MPSRHNNRQHGDWQKRFSGQFALRWLCPVCGHERRPGRDREHDDCRKELERRDAAIPNQRRKRA